MHTVEFFEAQFQQQVRRGEYALNPFEAIALDHLRGTVLDLGCGLGNLSLEAGRRGLRVVAVDASPTAIERIAAAAALEDLPVLAIPSDIADWRADRSYDTIVSIGLLMFFRRERALELLADIQEHVTPGGCAVINVLIEGTTFVDMFDADHHYLFGPRELDRSFAGWDILESRQHAFPAPGGTLKLFATIVARKR